MTSNMTYYTIGYIYKIVNDIDDKIYVGSTKTSINRRWGDHKSASLTLKYPIYEHIRKLGISHFNIVLIEEIKHTNHYVGIPYLHLWETYYINSLKTRLCYGGLNKAIPNKASEIFNMSKKIKEGHFLFNEKHSYLNLQIKEKMRIVIDFLIEQIKWASDVLNMDRSHYLHKYENNIDCNPDARLAVKKRVQQRKETLHFRENLLRRDFKNILMPMILNKTPLDKIKKFISQ